MANGTEIRCVELGGETACTTETLTIIGNERNCIMSHYIYYRLDTEAKGSTEFRILNTNTKSQRRSLRVL